ncbi:MAG: histidinol dehydrogenase [Clostridia bacterium]|nr:histidinol dehydrogenase [Clostridia bacterium]
MIQILKYGEVDNQDIFARTMPMANVQDVVASILADVRENGDKALYQYAAKFDGAMLSSLQVSPEEIEEALTLVEAEFLAVLKKAEANIRRFHEKQKREGFILREENGVVMGQKITPVDRAGLYVPGGTAAYPSTVLMDAIPAKIAGCKDVVMTTPPNKEGKINPAILAAAHIAGVDRIYKVGGAQAIAALAYGTETIAKVDKIVGPGNAYVAEAKRQVYGAVSIDMIAGPSEILIVADEKANPAHVAADLLSQAEHDKMASAVLVTDSEALALSVQAEIEKQIVCLPREAFARVSIDTNGKIIVADSLEVAVEIANEIAPEHLELCVQDPFAYLGQVRHAGSVFMGYHCPEALGDYLAGPNHTLPTSGSAKFASPLSVDDFIKKTQFTYFPKEALCEAAEDVALFAEKEGLSAHAKSATIRTEGKNE